jgi:hypothetical protein
MPPPVHPPRRTPTWVQQYHQAYDSEHTPLRIEQPHINLDHKRFQTYKLAITTNCSTTVCLCPPGTKECHCQPVAAAQEEGYNARDMGTATPIPYQLPSLEGLKKPMRVRNCHCLCIILAIGINYRMAVDKAREPLGYSRAARHVAWRVLFARAGLRQCFLLD